MTDTKKVTELSEITPTFSGLGLTMKVSSNNIKLTTPRVLESDGAQTVKCECQLPGYKSYGNCSVAGVVRCAGVQKKDTCDGIKGCVGEFDNKSTFNFCKSCQLPTSKDKQNPYILGFYGAISPEWSTNTTSSGGMFPVETAHYSCALSGTFKTYLTLITWENYRFGSSFFGSRIANLQNNELPITNTNYKLQACTEPTPSGTVGKSNTYSFSCTIDNNWCSSEPSSVTNMSKGWFIGQWTFPVTTQMTSFDKNTQDTLNWVATLGAASCLSRSATLNFPNTDLGSPPAINDQYIGLCSWLDGMMSVTGDGTQNPSLGFVRDYMIIKTFASVYCATLYGYVDPSGTTQNNKLPVTVREAWLLNNEDIDGDAIGLITTQGAPFGTSFFTGFLNLKNSYAISQVISGELPFHGLLSELVVKNSDMFKTTGGKITLTLPIDGFRMRTLINSSGDIQGDNFKLNILNPIIGCIKLSGQSSQKCPPYQIDENSFSTKYSGISYSNNWNFKTCKTSSTDYVSNNPISVSKVPVNTLWPENTHAWIQDDGTVKSGTMIEAFYYVSVDITKFSPGLAALYLSTTSTPALSSDVLQQIEKDTGLIPVSDLSRLCGTGSPLCKQLISSGCSTTIDPNIQRNFPNIQQKILFQNSQSKACLCYNSRLQAPKDRTPGRLSAMCFDENCSLAIPNTGGVTMNDIFNLTDSNCKKQCDDFNTYKDQSQNTGNALNPQKYVDVCGKPQNITFNTSFLIKLLVPSILIPVIILLAMGINKVSVIISVLSLLTLTGISVYLARLFTPQVRCSGAGAGFKKGGQLPSCTSLYDNSTELPLSFCDINMFCECPGVTNQAFCGSCKCDGDVCIPTDGTKQRETEVVQIKMVNIPMVVLFGSLLVLVPILIVLLRNKFFPKLPLFILVSIVILMFSIWGIGLYMSIARYSKSRVVYKDFDKYCSPGPGPGPAPGPSPSPGPTSVCDTQKFSPTILEQPGLPIIGYFPCNTTVTLGDKPVTYKCPDGGFTCRELLKQMYKDPDDIGCLGLYKNANSDFCSVQYQDPNEGSFGPYTKKTGCNPVLANAVECSQ